MRIAPENELAARVCAFALKVFKIELKRAVGLFLERRGQYVYARILGGVGKIAVGRGVYKHLLVLRAERFGKLIQRRDYAGSDAQLLLGEAPAVMIGAPFAEGVIVFVVIHARVAEYAAVDALVQRLDYLRCDGKLHIRDPHAHKLLVLEREHLFGSGVEDIAAKAVRVQGVRAAALNYLIKTIHIVFSLLFYELIILQYARLHK